MQHKTHVTCPDRPTLEQLAIGRLTDDDLAARLEEHVMYCSDCGETLQSISVDDSIVSDLHSLGTRMDKDEHGDEISRLIELLCERPKPVTSLTEGPRAKPSDRVVEILAPAREQDELGWMGPFRVDEVIAAGGMGVVLRGVDPHLQRTIAIKIMNPSLANDPAARTRFLREARAMATLEHDHIVTIHQVGEQGGAPYLVMPLLRGETLSERLRRCGTLDEEEATRIGVEIATGLAAAHKQGVIHKDIKPSNVWLEAGTDRVKLLDFGLTSVKNDTRESTPVHIIGSLGYLAPEQALGEVGDQRSDLFALGCILYEACSGASPFYAKDRESAIKATMQCEPRPLHDVATGISRNLSTVVMKLLKCDPSQRFQSSEDVIRALQVERNGRQAHQLQIPHRRILCAMVAAVLLGGIGAWWWGMGGGAGERHAAPSGGMRRATGHLFVMDADGGNLRQVTRHPSNFERFSSPDWSPDGRSIIFDGWSRGANSKARIFVGEIDGAEIRDLGPGMMPSFSPDGRRIAFSWPSVGIAIMNANGGNRKVLAADGWGAQWSPDGQWIACEMRSEDDRTGTITLIDVETEARRVALPGEAVQRYSRIYWNMEWSPDSQRICFRGALKEGGKVEIAVVSLGDEPEVVLLGPGAAVFTDFSWHPNGGSILLAKQSGQYTGYRLFRYDLATKRATRINAQPADRSNNSAAWSPDASRIVFTSRRLSPPKPE